MKDQYIRDLKKLRNGGQIIWNVMTDILSTMAIIFFRRPQSYLRIGIYISACSYVLATAIHMKIYCCAHFSHRIALAWGLPKRGARTYLHSKRHTSPIFAIGGFLYKHLYYRAFGNEGYDKSGKLIWHTDTNLMLDKSDKI
ncbi:hypothetical protein D3Z39_01235 [Anaerotruncus colihominis]|uniref:Uncharacterized protein n=1 Tax=Anaerotruncus colihominis TaxID=169435 RepID=A0A845RFL9_9FIRM|nr:hypothetical protein [Anaerotruncus colihominis]NBI77511.1 hypothetical protein [Anaerotruncus colihominis]